MSVPVFRSAGLRTLCSAAVLATAPAAELAAQQRTDESRGTTPTLVVLVTVDQLRPDYFERWGRQLTGGLARLAAGGAVFQNAHQDHAITETAPGHATTLSGRHPRSTGIVQNSAGVQDPQHPLIQSAGSGASPYRFRGSTLVDWLRIKDPRTRALSVSRKDRGAILPLGRAHQPAFWYVSEGMFTTSTYYGDTLPGWVQRFNGRKAPQQHAGKAWTLLLDPAEYPEPDTVMIESQGRGVAFPHPLPDDPALAARVFANFPWMDSLTLAFALEGAREMRLGAGPQTDLLAVSLSSTDAIGHQFGPDSRELHDQVLRLDRYLGAFIDSLYAMRDSASIVIALTADHGVAPFPEVHVDGGDARPLYVDAGPAVATLRAALRKAGLDTTAIRIEESFVIVDRSAVAGQRDAADAILRTFLRSLRRLPGVLRVDRPEELARRDTTRDVIARRWLHMLPSDLGVAAVITIKPYHVPAGAWYAMHGTPHDYDTRVPLILYGPPFRPGRYPGAAGVVDLAPTLARVLDVTPIERLDGRILTPALR